MQAATNDAPMLSRYDATTRGSEIVCQNAAHVIVALRAGSVRSGTITIAQRYAIVNPIVRRKPGRTVRRVAGANIAALPGAWTVDLIEDAAVGEVGLLSVLPPAEGFVDREQLDRRERARVFRGDLRVAWPVMVLRRDLLPFR